VCLSVAYQYFSSEVYELILVNFWRDERGQGTSRLDFGGNPVPDHDPGITDWNILEQAGSSICECE